MTAIGNSPAATEPVPGVERNARGRDPCPEYARIEELQVRPERWWRDVLGVVLYGMAPAALSIPLPDVPIVAVASEQLGNAQARAEIWRLPATESDPHAGRMGPVRYRHGRGLLFAALQLPATAAGPLQETTRLAYSALFETLRVLSFLHPVRLWNYLPDIHQSSAGVEHYEQFNAGRQDAFLHSGRRLSGDVPAASVLGLGETPLLTVYGLAAREAPLPVENPRQCSAWDYPPQYGERRPTFARACIERTGTARLFISGTASIVGHRSEHPGDPVAQTRETVRNIRALLAAANERVGAQRFGEQDLAYKVYVRRLEDQPAIEQVLYEELGAAPMRVFLRADVCRPELLVEIEAASV